MRERLSMFYCIYSSECNYYKYAVHLFLAQPHWLWGSTTISPASFVCRVVAQCEITGCSVAERDGTCVCVKVIFIWSHERNVTVCLLKVRVTVLRYGRYFTVGGQWYCSLNGVCYSEHYMEDTSQQVDSGIAAWMECVTVNIIWKLLHSRWTVVLQLEWSVLQWTLYGR